MVIGGDDAGGGLAYTFLDGLLSGSSSAVERQLPKLDVAGSIPVSRSNYFLFLLSAIATRGASVLVVAACAEPRHCVCVTPAGRVRFRESIAGGIGRFWHVGLLNKQMNGAIHLICQRHIQAAVIVIVANGNATRFEMQTANAT